MRGLFFVAGATFLVSCSSPDSGSNSGSAAPSGAPAATPPPSGDPSGASSAQPAATAAPAEDPCTGKTCLSIEKCEAGQCVPACPTGEVYVPPTPPEGFTLGRGKIGYGFGKLKGGTPANGIADAPHKVILTKPFCMDATEVTVRAIVKCVQEQGCRPPAITDRWSTYPKKLDYPVNMVEWDIARDHCEKQGQSLPSEAQWEWAATGGDGRDWPWGNETPNCEYADFTEGSLPSPGGDAGCHGGGPSAVGTHRKGDKIWPNGPIHDLAGNVWEWTLDSYVRFPTETETDPVHLIAGNLTHVVKGGGWNRSHRGIMTWFRGAAIHTYKVPGLGFRCVRNPK